VRADLSDVSDLSRTSLLVDIKVIVSEDGFLPHLRVRLGEPDARGEGRKLEEAISVEVILVLREAVEHLGGALRVAQVEDLFMAGQLLDFGNLCLSVVLAHFSPIEIPELLVLNRESLMLLTVLSATVVAKPHVEASIIQLKRKRYTFHVSPQPGCGI
jgi:hypothetical protein